MEITVKIEQIAEGKNLNPMRQMFPVINNFDHNCTAVVLVMNALKVEVKNHSDILSLLDVGFKLIYLGRLLKNPDCTKFRLVLHTRKDNFSGVFGKHWNLGNTGNLSGR